jgi:CRP/FNR family cyclic AMP-dependent transcriptional regulator
MAQQKRPAAPRGINTIAPLHPPEPGGGIFRVTSYEEEAVLYRAGEKVDLVFLLRGGRARLTRPQKGGGTVLASILRPGDLFGELFKSSDTTMWETATVDAGSEVWSVEGRLFREQVATRPEIAMDLLRSYAERTRAMRQRIWGLTVKDAPARLAETLLHLAETVGSPCEHGEGREIRDVIQQELADLTGVSRPLASTILNEMKRDGVLSQPKRNVLCLTDVEALKWLARKERFAA